MTSEIRKWGKVNETCNNMNGRLATAGMRESDDIRK